MAGFSNTTITAPKNKPHICYRNGWWRVSSMSKPYDPKEQEKFVAAHSWIRRKPGMVHSPTFTPRKPRARYSNRTKNWYWKTMYD